MTLITLIIGNAVLGLLVVWAVVHLLGHSIHAHRHAEIDRRAQVTSLPAGGRERVAA